jgi:hypothetical protein
MLRRVSDQARVEGKRALLRAIDGVRGHGAQRPVGNRARNPIEPSAAVENDAPDETTKALNRIADTIERMSVQLDAYQQERAEHFDAIEFLLRETIIGTALPSAARPSVRGGVVDPEAIEHIRADIDLSGECPLEIETAVEVRSRFHDRWICGFTISEVIGGPDRFRYRLTRRSDGIPLPILFESCDVRATDARPAWPRTLR